MSRDYMDLFDEAAEEVLQLPEGERDFHEMYITLMSNYGSCDCPDAKVFSNSPLVVPREVLLLMINSGKPFELYSTGRIDDVTWLPSLQSPEQQEYFFSAISEHKVLEDLINERKNRDKVIAGAMPHDRGERGNVFVVIDQKQFRAYGIKGYQNEFEKEAAQIFSGNIGPYVYGAGDKTLVEQFLERIGAEGEPDIKYLRLGEFNAESAGRIASILFTYIHNNRVAYNAWNWFHEVRVIREEGKKDMPKIFDFGSSQIFPGDRISEEDFELVAREDIKYVFDGLAALYRGRKRKKAMDSFDERYAELRE